MACATAFLSIGTNSVLTYDCVWRMKVLDVHLENFASYDKLDFEFDSEGLTLIHGATGSGKSTLCDAIPWCLFGKTAKGGAVDEVLSWRGGVTLGTIVIETPSGAQHTITRVRGQGNDLYFQDGTNYQLTTRGKDLADTQKLINNLLGMDVDLYSAGAYYSEFSQTSQFFTTTAKNRRAITEQLVDLSLPIKLQDSIKTKTKDLAGKIDIIETTAFKLMSKLDVIERMLTETKQNNDVWSHEIANKIATVQSRSDMFEVTNKHKITTLETELSGIKYQDPMSYDLELKRLKQSLPPKEAPCKECGNPKISTEHEQLLENITDCNNEKIENAYKLKHVYTLSTQINDLKDQENVYLNQLAELKTQTNPHTTSLLRLEKDYTMTTKQLEKVDQDKAILQDTQLNLDLLSDAVQTFRAELVVNTVEDLEAKTNALLNKHFDGEIRVNLQMTDADKLEVSIQKDGNEASFTQLSKGQRQMLKLAFGIAVMECVSNHHGLEFNQVFFDEALDGLDDNNRLKAVKMLETLALKHDSVFLVEHSETVKAQIDTKYHVELIDGRSRITV